MKYIDLFIYTAYSFLRKLGRSEDNAKWSSMLHISMFTVIFIITGTIFLKLIFWQYSCFTSFLENYWHWFILQVVFFCIYYLRYYKSKKFNEIEDYFSSINEISKRRLKKWYLLVNITIIILFVVLVFVNK